MLEQRLQEQFGIPATAMKTRDVPRVMFAYSGADGPQWLATQCSLIVNRVLPDEGQRRKYRRDHKQEELGASIGLKSRATFTRWMSRFCNSKSATLHRRRRKWRPNLYSHAIPEKKGTEWTVSRIGTGKVVHGGRFMEEQEAHDFCRERNRTAGKIEYQVTGRLLDEKCFFYPTAELLAAAVKKALDYPEQKQDESEWDYAERMRAAHVSRLFSQERCKELKLNGYIRVPEWVWHPSLGIGYRARLVLTYYIGCGILQTGWVQVHQEKVAKATRMSVKTVRRAERELEKIGLIRVVGQKRLDKQCAGMYPDWRSLNKILFLPIRTMTDEEIAAERQRRVQARRELHKVRKEIRFRLRGRQMAETTRRALEQKRFTLALQACKVARLHRHSVESCKGQTSSINTIWDAVRQKLLQAGIEPRLIAALIPSVLAPPGGDGRPLAGDSYQKTIEIRGIIEQSFKKAVAPRE